MIFEEEETFFECPYCFESISVLLDRSTEGGSTYVEDCEVCCHPISLRYQVEDGAITAFSADRLS